MATKDKGIDLGALQAEFEASVKEFNICNKAFIRAEEAVIASKIRKDAARDALQTATKAVLN